MLRALLFFLGAAAGSFLNVVAVRYRPDRFLLSPKVIGGRSRCPHCGHVLRWFELIPLLSFAMQRGRCLHCGGAVSFGYPLVEIISGLIFAFVPFRLDALLLEPLGHYAFAVAAWVLVFLTLLLVTLIDLRVNLIPDEANVFLAFLGILLVLTGQPFFAGASNGSFLGAYALLFGLRQGVAVNHAFGALAAAAFFAVIIAATKGKGMGMGDLKLASALGFVFGWPDVAFLTLVAFVLGSAVGAWNILTGAKTMKSTLPFGPFLAAGAAVTFFWGYDLAKIYFSLFGV